MERCVQGKLESVQGKLESVQGKLELIIGNMFSGKTSELIRRINKEKSISKRILVINYIDDNRYGSKNEIISHDNLKVNCIKVKKLNEILNFDDYDSFFIDEGQFFEDIYSFVLLLVDVKNKHVIVSGLDGDSFRNPFGDIIKLIPLCDTVDKLTAYCNKCNNGVIAPFTKKINGNTDLIDIGGIDKYIPVCRYHYFKL